MRLIDADATYEMARDDDYYSSFHHHMADLGDLYLLLIDAPTIETEPIVRCGKCANHKDFINDESHCRCLLLRQTVNKNDYCSFGEYEK